MCNEKSDIFVCVFLCHLHAARNEVVMITSEFNYFANAQSRSFVQPWLNVAISAANQHSLPEQAWSVGFVCQPEFVFMSTWWQLTMDMTTPAGRMPVWKFQALWERVDYELTNAELMTDAPVVNFMFHHIIKLLASFHHDCDDESLEIADHKMISMNTCSLALETSCHYGNAMVLPLATGAP